MCFLFFAKGFPRDRPPKAPGTSISSLSLPIPRIDSLKMHQKSRNCRVLGHERGICGLILLSAAIYVLYTGHGKLCADENNARTELDPMLPVGEIHQLILQSS